jgi:hypothetical protein
LDDFFDIPSSRGGEGGGVRIPGPTTPTVSGVSVSNISHTRWSFLFPVVEEGPEPFVWLWMISRTTETCNAKLLLPWLHNNWLALSPPKLDGENAVQLEERRRDSTTTLFMVREEEFV